MLILLSALKFGKNHTHTSLNFTQMCMFHGRHNFTETIMAVKLQIRLGTAYVVQYQKEHWEKS